MKRENSSIADASRSGCDFWLSADYLFNRADSCRVYGHGFLIGAIGRCLCPQPCLNSHETRYDADSCGPSRIEGGSEQQRAEGAVEGVLLIDSD